jgi:kynureninase
MTIEFSRDHALALDQADPLRDCRARFSLPPDVIYLDGNSLGALPATTAPTLAQVIAHEWGQGLIRSWNEAGWIDQPKRLGAQIAPLIGAQPDEVLVCDNTSLNLHKLAGAALAARAPKRGIVTEAGNFPSDLYVLDNLAPGSVRAVPADQLFDAVTRDTALLALTQVNYKTGALHDMAALTARAHQMGALVLWDLSHSVGAMPLDLTAAKCDLAIGCGYKFLNGGPGAPAFAYVAQRHFSWFRSSLVGWLGHQAPFDFDPVYRPATGIGSALTGTPGILAHAALSCGLSTFDGVALSDVRDKSMALGQLFLAGVAARLEPFGFKIACPIDPNQRGSQVSLRHPQAYAIMQALIARGVIGDFRDPDILRFGLTPLYLRYVDIFDAVENLYEVMDKELYRAPQYHLRHAVT